MGAPPVESYRDDPLCKAVRRLLDAGVVVVAAAGDDGKGASGGKIYGRIHAPGNEPSAITVGASNIFGTDAAAPARKSAEVETARLRPRMFRPGDSNGPARVPGITTADDRPGHSALTSPTAASVVSLFVLKQTY